MDEELTKILIISLSILVLILIKPIVKWFMRDKYKVYKDVLGNNIKIKTQGYMRGVKNE